MYEEFKAELLKLANENPDYVYKESLRGEKLGEGDYSRNVHCNYAERDGDDWVPSCIVGHVLSNLGITTPAELVSEMQNNEPADDVLDALAQWRMLEFQDKDDRRKSMRLMGVAQDYQDKGYTWSTAVERAIRAAEDI